MRKKQGIENAYEKFCLSEGNQHIASEFAIEKINELVNKFSVERILEVGLGIGSISGIIMEINRSKNLDYTGTEANEFCLKSLQQNLKEDYKSLKIFSDLKEIPNIKKFDFIIIDGKDQNLQYIKDLISEHGIVAIEGDRVSQLDSLQELFPKNIFVHSISLKKNKSYSPFPYTHWQGGLKIIFVNPTSSQKIWWAKEKIYTKLKYKFSR